MLTSIAREWIGTKWVHHQSSKGLGCDCVGFLLGVGEEANLNLPPIHKPYPRIPKHDDIKNYLDSNFDLTDEIEKDVILLIAFNGIKCHVAIATDKERMIHADSRKGKVIEQTIDDRIKGLIKYKYKVKER